MLGRLGLIEPSRISLDTAFKALSMVTDMMLEEDEQASVTGYVMIGDSTNMSLSHVVAFSPSLAKKAMVLWQVRRDDGSAAIRCETLSVADEVRRIESKYREKCFIRGGGGVNPCPSAHDATRKKGLDSYS